MKNTAKRITAMLLALLLTASLLVSCGSEKAESEEAVTEVEGTPVLEVDGVPVSKVDGVPLFHQYKSREVDLGLEENETFYDIIEIDGQLRATIGILDPNWDPEHPEEYRGKPYPTEHRWYSPDYVEDTTKREKTDSYHELTFPTDPTVDWVYGGEYMEDDWGKGVEYHFYRDGVIQDDVLIDLEAMGMMDGVVPSQSYGAYIAHLMVCDGIPFLSYDIAAVDEGTGLMWREGTSWSQYLYINGHFVYTHNYPHDYEYWGMIGIAGKPYALLDVKDKLGNHSTCLFPLTADTTEILPEGTKIEGHPTGGAFSDGRFGYFMSGTELWRTDGVNSECLIDLVPDGALESSIVRSVRALSDGRLLVSMDGKLIELSESDGSDTVTICNVGVIEYYTGFSDDIDDLSFLASEYNDQAEHSFVRVKEYEDVGNLNLAVLSGDVDMVITPNKFILNNYIKQDVLTPLEEALPALFEKDVLIESVVEATKVDGVCYYLPVNFELCGEYITDPSALKDGKLFENRVAYYDYIKKNDPEYFKNYTPDQILDTFANDLDEWIDWESNTCHFDDGTFSALLELCAMGSTQTQILDYHAAKKQIEVWWGRDGKAASFELGDAVESYRFTDVASAQKYQKGLPKAENRIGGPTTWVQVDFPMPSRVHEGYAIDAHNLYAVVDHEDTKAACGDFLRWLILEDVEEEFTENDKNSYSYAHRGWDGFSINKDETDRYLKRLWNSYLDPEAEAASANPEAVKIDPNVAAMLKYDAQAYNAKCGETQYEVTWDYIEKADHLRFYDSELQKVIRNEAQGFFTGSITAEKAAEYIQNRIQLYLDEQG